MNTILSLHHLAISVRDAEKSARFYSHVFGIKNIPRKTEGQSSNKGAWLQLGEIELHLRQRTEIPQTDQHFALKVNDMDEIVRRALEGGGSHRPAQALEGIAKRCFIFDPDQNSIELLQE